MKIRLMILSGEHSGKAVVLNRSSCTIGCAEDCDLRLRDPTVKPHHAALRMANGAVTLRPLDRHSAVHLNGDSLRKLERLKDGDRIRIGPLECELRIEAPVPAGLPDPSQPHVSSPGSTDDESAGGADGPADEPIVVVGVSPTGRWHPTAASASDAADEALKNFSRRH